MRATLQLVVTAVLCAGCGHLDGLFTRPRAASSYRAAGRPCAWLPDEPAQRQLRRSAVNDKVRRLIVPALQAAELDAWLLVERADQRDPMLDSLGLDEPGDKAVVFVDGGGTQPRAFGFGATPTMQGLLAASGLFEQVQPLTPEALNGALERFRPGRIGIDYSARVPLADGITTGTRQFAAWLVGREYAGTFRSAETLALTFRASRTPDEVDLARQAARCAAEIAERAVSGETILPDRTTGAEVAWRLLADIRDAGLDTRATPRLSLIKLDDGAHLSWPWLGTNTDTVIAAGDVVHIDFELRYAGVATTVQRTAYMLRRWESHAPADVDRGFDTMAQVRAGLAPLFRPGVDGRQIATAVRSWAAQNQIRIELMPHPVGNVANDVGTAVPSERSIGPYDMADALSDRPLQERDTQALAFRITVRLDNGRQLTLSASDDGVVGFGGLDLLVPPPTAVLLVSP